MKKNTSKSKIISILCIFSLISGLLFPINAAAVENSAKQIIVGFENLNEYEQSFQILKNDKPSYDALVNAMPQTLEAYIVDGSTAESIKASIEVSWECVGEDYELSDAYYFQFSPVWDETKYDLAEGLDYLQDVPYISVFFYDEEVGLAPDAVTSSPNETVIYEFLVNEMGLNTAAACGILANIYRESSFNPNATGDKGTSYGICQWHNSRWEAMKTWCNENGYDWTTLIGQLNYLKFELSQNNSAYLYNGKKIFNYISAVENSAQGAYDAGYYWCYYYEVPANKETTSVTRGNLAKDTYWAEYGTVAPTAILGDADNDGDVDVFDARLVLCYAVEDAEAMATINLENADYDGNGSIDVFDARAILQYVVNQ